jgi:hypothetical protein
LSFKRVILLAALASLAMPLASAQAWWRVGIGIGFPVYRPYPYRVYVAPAPVYVAPTYVQPAPVYVQPVPVQSVPVQPAPVYTQPAPALLPAPRPVPQTNQGLPPQPVPAPGQ